VLDHLLVDIITSIRRSFEGALLQRQAVEERFLVDVFLGDVAWETSYSLPGEEQPPRVRVDLSIDWPTWSQTSYRSWSIGEAPDELPEVVVEVALRIQRLAEAPDTEKVLAAFADESPLIGSEPLVRTSATIEEVHDESGHRWAVEATYEGSIRFEESHLEAPATIDPLVNVLTRWVSSTLVQLADLPLQFLPGEPADPAGPSRGGGGGPAPHGS
jgi:hypothetical protein